MMSTGTAKPRPDIKRKQSFDGAKPLEQTTGAVIPDGAIKPATLQEFTEGVVGQMTENLQLDPEEIKKSALGIAHADSTELPSGDHAVEIVIPQIGSPFPGNITVDLGFAELAMIDAMGYMPSRPEVILTPKAREAIKRLSLTLERDEAVLSDGSQVRNSTSKTIVWLCERLADAMTKESAI